MKRTMMAFTLAASALACSGAAVSGQDFVDQARVIKADPLYETIQVARPVTECWTERVTRHDPRRGAYIAPIAGGILGGVVGHQFGKGRGKTALTVAGTLLGASLGRGYSTAQHRPRPRVENVQQCKTVNRYERAQHLVGYRVKYSYEGQTHYTQTTEHPGEFIPVRVRVSPANGV